MAEYMTIAANLVFVTLMIIAAVFFLKKFNTFTLSKNASHLTVINTLPISPREKIILLQIYEKQLLIGVTSQNIVTLLTLDHASGAEKSKFVDKEPFSEVMATLDGKHG